MSGIAASVRREVVVKSTRLRFPGAGRVAVDLSVRVIDPDEGGLTPGCPHCESGLNLHQPDECAPDQLLATCDSCFRWYCLVELGDRETRVLMVELPSKSVIEKAFGESTMDPQ